uniref:Zinc transporter 1 n=1 Tax=Aceria tosichella TaxID=561515 RepID=A0A6G1SL57_9ACAR
MQTKFFYYFILLVYCSLWICQLIACHLTHSLIILTDSYINLYRIFDISLGILHLSTQQSLAKSRSTAAGSLCGASGSFMGSSSTNFNKSSQTLAYKLFESACSYQYKRLPLLGSFVNGMFLAALLMSAAIEGLQTCFHVKHSENHDKKTILTQNVATYPIILAGFALVGLIMQYCSLKAHEMREEELCSDSFLNLTTNKTTNQHQTGQRGTPLSAANGSLRRETRKTNVICIKELNTNNLVDENTVKVSSKRRSYDLNLDRVTKISSRPSTSSSSSSLSVSMSDQGPTHKQLPLTIRTSEVPHDEEDNRISLRSLRYSVDLDTSSGPAAFSSLTNRDLEASKSGSFERNNKNSHNKKAASKMMGTQAGSSSSSSSSSLNHDKWFLVRCLASPVALLTCGIIFYVVPIGLATEISDAALAVSVVVLLFATSYPPMKKAGKILLQSVPDGVDLDELTRELIACGSVGDILEVTELRVWSLTSRSNRVGTCKLVLNTSQVTTENQVRQIIHEAKFKFLDQQIKCTTIEPVFSTTTKKGACC